MTGGVRQDLEALINDAVFTSDTDEMVIVRNIEMYSLCEHHVLPFIGKCHVAYIPKGKVIGISKIARIVENFARRLQVQERLTSQIADFLAEGLGASGVAVVLEASHTCMSMRGVRKPGSAVVTSALRGQLLSNTSTRQEVLSLIQGHRTP